MQVYFVAGLVEWPCGYILLTLQDESIQERREMMMAA
jgi:hypothetical protein